MNLRKQIFTENDCYKAGRTITPKGVMVHSTGADNPNLRRYVAPNDGLLGEPSMSHWNQSGKDACVHAFIGRLADGSVATYQTLPWDMKAWHSGRGKRGSANNTHIGIEICEDGLKDASYFKAVYREAVELFAYLCKRFNLDPLAPGVILCHSEGRDLGIASNHGDVMHWFPKHGKTMDDFRADVALEMEDKVTQDKFDEMMDNWMARKAKLPESSWSKIKQAKENGLTDGSRPQSFATREEVVTMIVNAMKK